jgi:hypothetical protein
VTVCSFKKQVYGGENYRISKVIDKEDPKKDIMINRVTGKLFVASWEKIKQSQGRRVRMAVLLNNAFVPDPFKQFIEKDQQYKTTTLN